MSSSVILSETRLLGAVIFGGSCILSYSRWVHKDILFDYDLYYKRLHLYWQENRVQCCLFFEEVVTLP